MSSNIKVLQVIPKLGYGGAETGCYDIAHYLPENNCKSFIVTSGGELIKISKGFLLCTGSLKILTFFLSTNLSNSPPLVTINDLQLFSGK